MSTEKYRPQKSRLEIPVKRFMHNPSQRMEVVALATMDALGLSPVGERLLAATGEKTIWLRFEGGCLIDLITRVGEGDNSRILNISAPLGHHHYIAREAFPRVTITDDTVDPCQIDFTSNRLDYDQAEEVFKLLDSVDRKLDKDAQLERVRAHGELSKQSPNKNPSRSRASVLKKAGSAALEALGAHNPYADPML